MLATIVLPPGTERVTLGDIPSLFANAIHPPVPENTPRVLSYLQKEAVTRELSDQWCGYGNNFPITLTHADLEALNVGVWASLAPLELLPERDDGPTKLQTFVTQPEWEPYRLAFEANPPHGWRLLAVWRNTVMEQWLMAHQAQKEWKALLEQHAARGDIAPRSPTSYIPTTGAIGQQLQGCFFTVPEFADFAAKFSIKVHVQRLFTRKPLVAELLATLRKEPQDENVTVEEAIGGFRGQSSNRVREFVEQFEDIADRQVLGYFTIGEAAQMLGDSVPGLDVKDLIGRLEAAVLGEGRRRRRLVRSPSLMPLADGAESREYLDLVTIPDVDAWLSEQDVPYRLAPLVPAYRPDPLGNLEELPLSAYTVPLFEHLQAKTPWAGGRMAPVDMLSLEAAAKQASKHAGQEVTPEDFLRAGARGEIPIRGFCSRTVTMQPVRRGDISLVLNEDSYPFLPTAVCEALSLRGTANLRSIEYSQNVDSLGGSYRRFTRWQLAEGEPGLLLTVKDCLVLGADVHALADEFLSPTHDEPVSAPTAPAPEAKAAPATSPRFSTPRSALIAAHEHRWQTIRRDLQDASSNGLSAAKAGPREWYESVALEWAKAKGKLKDEGEPTATDVSKAMNNMASLPGTKHRIQG